MINQLRRYLVDTITVQTRASTPGVDGDPVWNAKTTASARVERKTGITEQPDGTTRVTDTEVLLTTALTEGDRVWLPGASTSDLDQARRVITVKSVSDRRGVETLYLVTL